jgi:hypothetical protein
MGIAAGIVAGVGAIASAASGRSAARRAADAQRNSAQAGIQAQQEAIEQLRGDLGPFREFGAGLLPQAQQLFGANAGQQITQDPVFQSLAGAAREQIEARQAARGRTFLPETDVAIQDAFLRTGSDLLGQRQASLLNAIGVGQSSAARTGQGAIQTGGNISNLLTQIGNVQAGGIAGQQAATQQGLGNLISILGATGAFRGGK